MFSLNKNTSRNKMKNKKLQSMYMHFLDEKSGGLTYFLDQMTAALGHLILQEAAKYEFVRKSLILFLIVK